jgi:hypothetical protein
MSFRKNNINKIEQELNTATRKNQQDDIKDSNQETRIQILETLLINYISSNIQYTNEINDLKTRLSLIEIRYNKTFPSSN